MGISELLWYLFLAYLGYKVLYWAWFGIGAYRNYQKGGRIRRERDGKVYDFPAENQDVLRGSTIQELRNGQFNGKFTARDIVNTYAKRCYTIGRKYNYTGDEMFERALKEAEEKDKQLKDILDQRRDPRKNLGKLHGIPFSVKDHIWVEGTISSVGLGSMTDNIRNKDAYIVQAFRKQGAIPLVKGNMAEGGLSHHTTNLVWGEAKNPWDLTRTGGGSSGGDGGLIASGGIPFSLGSDGFGSLRVPAQFGGVYTLNPTQERIYAKRSDTYLQDNIQNFEMMKYVLGPLARNASDLTLLSQIIFSEDVYKEYIRYPKVPFNKALHSNKDKLKIGILNDSGKISTLSKTAERSIEIAAQIFEDNEYEVNNVDLVENIEEHSHMMLLKAIYTNLIPLKNNWLKSKDFAGATLFASVILALIPDFILKILGSIFSLFKGKRKLASIGEMVEPTAQEIMDFTMKKQEMIEKTVYKWKELGLDALIVPTFPIPAFKHENANPIGTISGGYSLSNFWGFPSGSVPITTVREDEQEYKDPAFNDAISKACDDTMQNSKGMPMGVEIICLPYKEEQVLRIMELLQKDSKFHSKYPYPKIE